MAYEEMTVELTFEEQVVIMAGLQLVLRHIDNGDIANDFFAELSNVDIVSQVRAKLLPMTTLLNDIDKGLDKRH